MRWYTHILCSALFLSAAGRFIPLTYAGVALGLMTSILPDVVEHALRIRHRNKVVHNFATGAVLTVFLLAMAPALLPLGMCYIHHLILDITRGGVYVLHKRVKSPLRSYNTLHNVFVILLHLVLLSFLSQ